MGGKRTRASYRKRAAKISAKATQPPKNEYFPPPSTGTTLHFRLPPISRKTLAEGKAIDSLPADTTVFKYLSELNTQRILSGNIRIGTLYDFRKTEHNKGISDPLEGTKKLYHPGGKYDYIPGTPQANALSSLGIELPSSGSMFSMYGVNIVREVEHPDCYVWCCSSKADRSLFESLEGTQACVSIRQAGIFFEKITEAINSIRRVKFLGFREIEYTPRFQTWNQIDLGTSAAFTKEPDSYGSQYEIRAVWLPLDEEPIEPIIFSDVKGILNLAQRIDLSQI